MRQPSTYDKIELERRKDLPHGKENDRLSVD